MKIAKPLITHSSGNVRVVRCLDIPEIVVRSWLKRYINYSILEFQLFERPRDGISSYSKFEFTEAAGAIRISDFQIFEPQFLELHGHAIAGR